MYKFAFAIALTLAATAGWIATTTHARVEAPVSAERINPSQIALNATNLPVEHFDDQTFVF
jgi:hypothetical protein